MFLLFVILLVIAVVYFYPQPKNDYKSQAKKYSGVCPAKYSEFVNNLELSEQMSYSVTQSSKYLYKALDALQDIPLYAVDGSSGLISEIHELASLIGDSVERNIAQTAIKQGVRFVPRYIKDIQDEELEVRKVAIPSDGPWYKNAETGFATQSPDAGWVNIEGNPDLTDEVSASAAQQNEKGFQVYTASTGPWASPIDPITKPVSNKTKWTQFLPKPFINTMYDISRVMLPKSA
jgi:hypothetical protein